MPWRTSLLLLVLWQGCAPSIESVPAGDLDALRERADYAKLDEQAVRSLAHAASKRWPQELAGFTLAAVEQFAAGGRSHWMSIWRHRPTGLEFVLLPGGRFRMGSPATEPDRRDDEPRHWVTLDPFLVARTECTLAAWCNVTALPKSTPHTEDQSRQIPIAGIGPVEVESWCRQAHLTFPTEAQWEYACRAGTTSPWATGLEKQGLIRFANLGSAECPADWLKVAGITENWSDGYGDATAEVGSFACNAFGLHDVHGNLNEWCRDDYADYATPAAPGTGEREGPTRERVARGGGYGGGAAAARSARRLRCGSGVSPGGGGNNGFGFRASLDLPF